MNVIEMNVIEMETVYYGKEKFILKISDTGEFTWGNDPEADIKNMDDNDSYKHILTALWVAEVNNKFKVSIEKPNELYQVCLTRTEKTELGYNTEYSLTDFIKVNKLEEAERIANVLASFLKTEVTPFKE